MKKIRKALLVLPLTLLLFGCGNKSKKNDSNDEKYQIYQLAKDAGYTGTYDEWLNSIKGKDGKGIVDIKKTDTIGLVDTYTITFTDGSTTTFDITNGSSSVVESYRYDGDVMIKTVYTSSRNYAMMEEYYFYGTWVKQEIIEQQFDNNHNLIVDSYKEYRQMIPIGGGERYYGWTGSKYEYEYDEDDRYETRGSLKKRYSWSDETNEWVDTTCLSFAENALSAAKQILLEAAACGSLDGYNIVDEGSAGYSITLEELIRTHEIDPGSITFSGSFKVYFVTSTGRFNVVLSNFSIDGQGVGYDNAEQCFYKK